MPENNNQPWTWKPPESSESIKSSMRRHDAYDRVSGIAAFTRDIDLPGVLYAKILTSPYAHAKIASMDTSKAQKVIGVRDILKFDDPDIAKDGGSGTDNNMAYSILTLPGTGDFYQAPMGVVVVADNEEICDRALRLIDIKWEERPFVLDMEDAAKPDAPKIMTESSRMGMGFRFGGSNGTTAPNVITSDKNEVGDVDAAFKEADKVVEYAIHRAMNSPAGVEAMACVAQWRGDYLDIWVHHQENPHSKLSKTDRGGMGGGMGMPPMMGGFGGMGSQQGFTHGSKITINFPYQGSWYGGLSWLAYSDLFIRLAVILAKRAQGAPVKLLYDESNFYCGGDEAGTYTCKVGAKRDGTITGYHWHMAGARNPATDKTHECTKIKNIRGTQVWPFTNRGYQACFRHGAASCVPHNVMFDRVAAEFGLDPTEVALNNDGCQGNDWDFITQYQKENGFPQRHSLKEVIERGKKAIDWDRKWHAPGAKKLANGRMHGMGFTSVNEWSWGGMGFPSHGCLILRDGKVTIVGLRCDAGIDTESGYRACVAAELGMKFDDVLIQEQRVDNGAFSLAQPASSAGTTSGIPQLIAAARELKQTILERASRSGFMPGMPGMPFDMGMPGMPMGRGGRQGAASSSKKPEDYDIKDSMVFEKANPGSKRSIMEVSGGGGGFMGGSSAIMAYPEAGMMGMMSRGPMGSGMYVMARQAHFIEAEVDVETGMTYLTNVVCVNDIGHLFNRQGAEAQQYGGAVMGIGKSATEEKIYCPKTGVGLNLDHINYHIGTMNDYPVVDCHLIECHLGYTPYGACGIGEDIGAAMAAITSSAIYNATGKWALDYPLTPDKVLKALGKI
jgi:CO/xanthine dehydrogenase Mo-binding subunit